MRHLLTTCTPPNQRAEFAILYDHADPKKSGAGGIIKNGEDYAGFIAEAGVIVDYDMVYELSPAAFAALRAANFQTADIEAL